MNDFSNKINLRLKQRSVTPFEIYHNNAVKNLSQEKQTAENRAMIETYNKKVDFVDFSSLDKIISEILED